MLRSKPLVFLLAMVLGALIWVFSPMLSGQPEPWDGNAPYYFGSLLLAGLLSGSFMRGPPSAAGLAMAYVGIVLGQLIVMLAISGLGPLFPLGVMFLLLFTLVAVPGVGLGAWIASRINGWSAP